MLGYRGCDGGREYECSLRLVVGDLDVEGFAEFGELVWRVGGECGPEVGDGSEDGFDLAWAGVGWLVCVELLEFVLDGGALGGELLDALLGDRDDWMVWVLVFFESEPLPVEGALDVCTLVFEVCFAGGVFAPAVVGGLGEFFAEQLQPVGAEESSGEKVEERLENVGLFDPEDAGVASGLCGSEPAPGDELAAVPVGALLVASFQPAAALAATDSAAERVEAPFPLTEALAVGLGGLRFRSALVPGRLLVDCLEEVS